MKNGWTKVHLFFLSHKCTAFPDPPEDQKFDDVRLQKLNYMVVQSKLRVYDPPDVDECGWKKIRYLYLFLTEVIVYLRYVKLKNSEDE